MQSSPSRTITLYYPGLLALAGFWGPLVFRQHAPGKFYFASGKHILPVIGGARRDKL
jgi:hypothetical protein